jgi:hypothetical protein
VNYSLCERPSFLCPKNFFKEISGDQFLVRLRNLAEKEFEHRLSLYQGCQIFLGPNIPNWVGKYNK